MHSLWNRANSWFFYGLSVLFVLAFGSYLTTLFHNPAIVVNTLRIHDVRTLRPMREQGAPGRVTDRAIFTLDLDADFTPLFNWNVKQVYAFVTAEYQTEANQRNEIVVWDAILTNTSIAHVKLSGSLIKYPVIDPKASLSGVPIALSLNWDTMPITGFLALRRQGRFKGTLPSSHCADGGCHPLWREVGTDPLDVSPPAFSDKAPAAKAGTAAAEAAEEVGATAGAKTPKFGSSKSKKGSKSKPAAAANEEL